jgi:hypothetical protein
VFIVVHRLDAFEDSVVDLGITLAFKLDCRWGSI